MSYLRLRRAQLILACFLISSILFVEFPAIDLGISRMLFDDGFYLKGPWTVLAHESVLYFLGLSLVLVVGPVRLQSDLRAKPVAESTARRSPTCCWCWSSGPA